MKCLMPLNQRQAIAESINGKRYVEWGSGGTTLWLSEHANPSRAVTIEHDAQWLRLVLQHMRDESWDFSPQTGIVPGQNATPAEEVALHPAGYIDAGVSVDADVYLVDGVVRGDCLKALVKTGRPMTVFIHDTQRDWYDDAIAEAVAAGFERTDYPEGEDYPGCLLTKLERT